MKPGSIFQPSVLEMMQRTVCKIYNRLPTGAHSVEDGRVADDDGETGQGEAEKEEKHLGRSAKPRVESIS